MADDTIASLLQTVEDLTTQVREAQESHDRERKAKMLLEREVSTLRRNLAAADVTISELRQAPKPSAAVDQPTQPESATEAESLFGAEASPTFHSGTSTSTASTVGTRRRYARRASRKTRGGREGRGGRARSRGAGETDDSASPTSSDSEVIAGAAASLFFVAKEGDNGVEVSFPPTPPTREEEEEAAAAALSDHPPLLQRTPSQIESTAREMLEALQHFEETEGAVSNDRDIAIRRLNAEFEHREQQLRSEKSNRLTELHATFDVRERPIQEKRNMLWVSLAELLQDKLVEYTPPVSRAHSNSSFVNRVVGCEPPDMTKQTYASSRFIPGAGRLRTGQREGCIHLVGVLDSNRVPLADARRRNVGPSEFLRSFRILTEDEEAAVERDIEERVFRVTYQRVDSELGGQPEYLPIEIHPSNLSLVDYKITFGHRTNGRRPFGLNPFSFREVQENNTADHQNNDEDSPSVQVAHKRDGPVICRGISVEAGATMISDPVELYTQVVSPTVLNVVHIHINDLADECAVAVVNLTGLEQTVDDVAQAEFETDAAGRQLNYKIVVDDSRVVAVLFARNGETQRADFVEYALPPPGGFVELPNDQLGVLTQIPRGLVVAVDPNAVDLPENLPVYERNEGLMCTQKHPVDVPGWVDVEVRQEMADPNRDPTLEQGIWACEACTLHNPDTVTTCGICQTARPEARREVAVVHPARPMCLPVCCLSKASPEVVAEHTARVEEWTVEQAASATERLAALLSAVRAGPASNLTAEEGMARVRQFTAEREAIETLLGVEGVVVEESELRSVQRGIAAYAAQARALPNGPL